jgi:hypothetical protein
MIVRTHIAAQAPTVFVLLILATSGSAQAATTPTRAPAVQTVLDCRKVAEDAQRLSCYDHAVDAMAKADATGDLVTVDREQRRTLRRQAFGFNLPSLSMFDKADKVEETEKLTAKIAGATQTGAGKWRIELDDGAVWLQTDDTTLYPLPKAGSTATIRKGALGSFFLTFDGKQSFRARREN